MKKYGLTSIGKINIAISGTDIKEVKFRSRWNPMRYVLGVLKIKDIHWRKVNQEDIDKRYKF